jgi:hypothetical protein
VHCRNRLAGFNAVDVEGRSLIVSGMLAESLLLAAVAVNLVIAWLIVLAGMLQLRSRKLRAHSLKPNL